MNTTRLFHHLTTTIKKTCLASLTGSLVLAVTVGAREIPFASSTTIDPSYDGARSVAVADFDGDGISDVVAAALNDSTLTWWRGLGDGTFTAHTIASGVSDMTDLSVVDLDRNGHLDVLLASAGNNDFFVWYRNDGDPTSGIWYKNIILTGMDGAAGVAAGDLDGDGDFDVVGTAATTGLVKAIINLDGLGTSWAAEDLGAGLTGVSEIELGDLDGDGDLDCAATLGDDDSVAWWERNHSTGTWTGHLVGVLNDPATLAIADLDRDGDLDVVAGSDKAGAMRWWANSGNGSSWSGTNVGASLPGYSSVAVADVDRDGDPDVAFADLGNTVGWWDNTAGTGLVWAGRSTGSLFGSTDVAVGDLNGDGEPDFVGASESADDVVWWRNQSIHRSASFPRSETVSSAFGVTAVLVPRDMDADGDIDLLMADPDNQLVQWFANPGGAGGAWDLETVRTVFGAQSADAGDIDGDGLVDVVGSSDSSILWWRNTGTGTYTENAIPSTQGYVRNLQLGDLDGDGDLDLVAGSIIDGIQWYENLGIGGSWAENTVHVLDVPEPLALILGDWDSDGDLDVVAADDAMMMCFANRLDSHGDFDLHSNIAAGLDVLRSPVLGDIDGDGDLDVVAVERSGHSVSWWSNLLGDGSSWGSALSIASGLLGPRSTTLADIDLDGDLDVAVVAQDYLTSTSEVAWFENRHAGVVWVRHTVSDETTRPTRIVAFDLDGNGAPDLVHDRYFAHELDWWPNLGGQASLATVDEAPASMAAGSMGALLSINVAHRGRTGDADVEPAELVLRFTDDTDTPLSSSEANALFERLYVFLDQDESGVFEPAEDAVVTTVHDLSLASGVETVVLPDNDYDVQIAVGAERLYFIVVVLDQYAGSQEPSAFRATHLGPLSVVEDSEHDLPLLVEGAEDVSSGVVEAIDIGILFADSFETGDLSAWASHLP